MDFDGLVSADPPRNRVNIYCQIRDLYVQSTGFIRVLVVLLTPSTLFRRVCALVRSSPTYVNSNLGPRFQAVDSKYAVRSTVIDYAGFDPIRTLVHSPLVFPTADWQIRPMQTLHEDIILENLTKSYRIVTVISKITVITLFPQGPVTCAT